MGKKSRKPTDRVTVTEFCDSCGAEFLMEAPRVAAVRLSVVWKASHYCNRQWWEASPGERKTLPQPGPGKHLDSYSRKYFGETQKGKAQDGTKTGKSDRSISVGRRRRAGDRSPAG